MSLLVAPPAHALLIAWLRAQPEVAARVTARVYSRLLATKTFPLVLVTRASGGPVAAMLHSLHDPLFQITVYGAANDEPGTQVTADTIAAVLDQRFHGVVTVGALTANISDTQIGGLHAGWDSVDPKIPVVRFDTRVYIRPL